jgi:hypothetical protein
MSNIKGKTLVDVDAGVHVDSWRVTNEDVGMAAPRWSVEKRTLRGGLSDGVEVVEVDNGALRYTILLTRGMSIWRGSYQGVELGWRSPVHGPVHPAFVNEMILGNLGWLAGFDEWIVRCGLYSNGAPGTDVLLDNNGNRREMSLPLHGRVANLPAHRAEVRIDLDPPGSIEVIGEVDESILFFQQLRLRTSISTAFGANRLRISDVVTNRKGQPGEMQMLYHCNFGPPLLEEGSSFLAPVRVVAPRDKISQEGISNYANYPAPVQGIIEKAFYFELSADLETGRTLTVLRNKRCDLACALRFSTRELPWFTLWKNPGAMSDGYVTGMEPGTNLPNLKSFERSKGRVVELPPGGSYSMTLDVEVGIGKETVERLSQETRKLQDMGTLTVRQQPAQPYSNV